MNLTELRNSVEKYFHVGFDISQNGEIACISPSNSDYRSFEIVIENRNDIRLVLKAEAQKYGGDLLRALSKSSTQKRKNCCSVKNNVDIFLNGIKMSDEEFINYNNEWNSFYFSTEILPYDPKDDSKVIKQTICLISMMLSLVDYSIEGFEEGKEKDTISKRYERNPINRKICLDAKGYKCVCCGFDFEKVYGEVGKETIEVHHTTPVHLMGDNYVVNPVEELEPVCSNCHTIIHKKDEPYTIEEVKEMLKSHS